MNNTDIDKGVTTLNSIWPDYIHKDHIGYISNENTTKLKMAAETCFVDLIEYVGLRMKVSNNENQINSFFQQKKKNLITRMDFIQDIHSKEFKLFDVNPDGNGYLFETLAFGRNTELVKDFETALYNFAKENLEGYIITSIVDDEGLNYIRLQGKALSYSTGIPFIDPEDLRYGEDEEGNVVFCSKDENEIYDKIFFLDPIKHVEEFFIGNGFKGNFENYLDPFWCSTAAEKMFMVYLSQNEGNPYVTDYHLHHKCVSRETERIVHTFDDKTIFLEKGMDAPEDETNVIGRYIENNGMEYSVWLVDSKAVAITGVRRNHRNRILDDDDNKFILFEEY